MANRKKSWRNNAYNAATPNPQGAFRSLAQVPTTARVIKSGDASAKADSKGNDKRILISLPIWLRATTTVNTAA